MEPETRWKEVDPEDVPLVLEEMAKGGKDSIFILNCIRRTLKWSVKLPGVTTKMYRPENVRWQRSVIATAEGRLNVAFIFSPYKSCTFLTSALSGDDIIKWKNGPMVYFGVPVEFFGRLENEIISSGLPTAWSYVFNSYWLPLDTAKKFRIDVPDGFTLSRLDESHASTVNSVWPYATATSLALVNDTIQMKETVGLFEEGTSQLVSWVLHVYYGLGMLYTVKEHRRNGYGTTVVKAITKGIVDGGCEGVTLLVKEDNAEASAVFQNLGFQETGPLQVVQILS